MSEHTRSNFSWLLFSNWLFAFGKDTFIYLLLLINKKGNANILSTDFYKCFAILISPLQRFLFNYIQHHTSLAESENVRRTENKNLFDPELPINNIFPRYLTIEGAAKEARVVTLYIIIIPGFVFKLQPWQCHNPLHQIKRKLHLSSKILLSPCIKPVGETGFDAASHF